MADKISASITYLDTNNNKGTKAVTDISPTADNSAIKNFCVGLLGLTTNTLSQIDRVEKTDITNATTKPKVELPDFNTYASLTNIKEAEGSFNAALSSGDHFPNFTYYVDMPSDWTDIQATFTVYNQKSSAALLKMLAYVKPDMPGTVTGEATITIYFEETETTAATTAVITIPVTGNATLTIL